jgi:hypothetical protein
MKRFIVIMFMVLLLVVSPLLGCSNSSGGVTNPIGLVPAKANMVGHVDLSTILQDKDLTGIYDKLPKDASNPQTFNDALTQLKDEYNIDLKGFEEVVFFADVSQSLAAGNYSAAIVKGTFNKNDLIAAIQSEAGVQLNTIKYKDSEIYTDEFDEIAIAFLDDSMFVIGMMQPVKDVIDVRNGNSKALSGGVLDTYNSLGDALIKAAVAVPPGVIESDLGQSASEFLGNISVFDKVQTVGMTASKNDQSVALNVKLCCADSDSAQSVENSINGLIGFIGLFMSMSGNQTLNSLLNKVEVSRSDSCVNVSVSMTITEIEDLIQSSNQTA